MAVVFGKLMAADPQWRYGVLFPGVLSLIRLCLSHYMLESPEWLRTKGRQDEAWQIESRLGFKRSSEEQSRKSDTKTDGEAGKLETKAQATNIIALESTEETEHNETVETEKDTKPSYHRVLFCSVTLPAIGHLGIGAIIFYSAQILHETSGLDSWTGSVFLMSAFFVGSTFILFLVDKYGRKPLLLLSTSGVGVTCTLLTVMLMMELDAAILFCLVGIMIFFQIGLGPLPFFYIAELSPIEYRGHMMSYGLAVLWISDTAVSLLTPLMITALGNFVFVPFASVTTMGIFIFYFFFPETKR